MFASFVKLFFFTCFLPYNSLPQQWYNSHDDGKTMLPFKIFPRFVHAHLGNHVGVLGDVALLGARCAGLLAHGEHQLAGLDIHVQDAHAHLFCITLTRHVNRQNLPTHPSIDTEKPKQEQHSGNGKRGDAQMLVPPHPNPRTNPRRPTTGESECNPHQKSYPQTI